MSRLFTSDVQSTGASASAVVLPMHIQGWFPLGFTDLISLQSKGLSRVFSRTAIWKHQFFTQPSFWSSPHICTWLEDVFTLWESHAPLSPIKRLPTLSSSPRNALSAHSLHSCLTLCDLMNCSPPDSLVHGILQARILQWGAIPSSRGASWPRNWTSISCICRWILYPLSHLGNPWNPLPTEK